jgi:hypothetical protein
VTVAEHLPDPETAAAPVDQLPALLEGLLFVSPSPARVTRLAQAAGVTVADVEAALRELAAGLGSRPAPPAQERSFPSQLPEQCH